MLKTLYLVSEFTIETLQHLSAVNGCSTPVLSYHQIFQFISANIIRESSYHIQIVPARISTFCGQCDLTRGREDGSLCSVRVDGVWIISDLFQIQWKLWWPCHYLCVSLDLNPFPWCMQMELILSLWFKQMEYYQGYQYCNFLIIDSWHFIK